MPGTIITHVRDAGKGTLIVSGTTTDNGTIKKVLVNGKEAQASQPNFAQWRVTLTNVGAGNVRIEAFAEDMAGNVESSPHQITWK